MTTTGITLKQRGKEEEEEIDYDFSLPEEPENFRPPSPKATVTSFQRKVSAERELNGPVELTVHLPPRHSLWAHELWNAGKSLTNYIDAHPEIVRGKRVLELGAAASLPSIVSCLNRAERVVSTDYPDPTLLYNIVKNAKENLPASSLEDGSFSVEGFIWGSKDTIKKLIHENGGEGFDVILLADVIFNHNQHVNLLESCKLLLKRETGMVLTTFSHHVVKAMQKDLVFFEIAKELQFQCKEIYQEKWEEMFPEDSGSLEIRQTVFAWQLSI